MTETRAIREKNKEFRKMIRNTTRKITLKTELGDRINAMDAKIESYYKEKENIT